MVCWTPAITNHLTHVKWLEVFYGRRKHYLAVTVKPRGHEAKAIFNRYSVPTFEEGFTLHHLDFGAQKVRIKSDEARWMREHPSSKNRVNINIIQEKQTTARHVLKSLELSDFHSISLSSLAKSSSLPRCLGYRWWCLQPQMVVVCLCVL